MSGTYVWGAMGRTVDDSTTVDAAIGEAIDAHLADPDAHLDATGSLQSHRAAEIIDHLAESVVNDKIAPIARSYVAIVDPSSDVDFDTIQAAVDYAVGKGGGTIFLTAGDHYLSGKVDLPMSINMYAADAESCRVHANKTTGDYFNIVDDSVTGQLNNTFENITFISSGGAVFYSDTTGLTNVTTCEFIKCTFTGGGQLRYVANQRTIYRYCIFYCGSTAAVSSDKEQRLYNCNVLRYSTTATPIFASFHTNYYDDCTVWAFESVFDFTGATTAKYFDNIWDFSIHLFQCRLIAWDYQNPSCFTFDMQNCYVTGKANRVYTISSDGNEGVIAFNTILASGTGYILPFGPPLKFIGNYMTGAATHASSDITILDDMSVDAWKVLSNTATVLNMANYWAVQLTPNSTRTVTTNVPRAGEKRTLIILTSGTTSYTLTFGTGFKTTGTLVTGTTSARRFVINFVSDGTYLIETSRTVAIA